MPGLQHIVGGIITGYCRCTECHRAFLYTWFFPGREEAQACRYCGAVAAIPLMPGEKLTEQDLIDIYLAIGDIEGDAPGKT